MNMLMPEKRSLRLSVDSSSRVTSVQLEAPFWDVLEEMAINIGWTLPQLISEISARMEEKHTGVTLSSCLRVLCLSWHERQAPLTPNCLGDNQEEAGKSMDVILAAFAQTKRYK